MTLPSGGDPLAGGSGSQVYRVTAGGTYYIIARANDAASKFSVSETIITDNRICANAETLAVGTESDAIPADASYWYKLTLTAGKTYDIETTSGNVNYRLYSGDCGSNTPVSSPTITKSGIYTLQVSSYSANSKFKVYEITDNRACSNATPITLGTPTTLPTDDGYWFTIDLVAGRTYNIQWSNGGDYVAFYDDCDGTHLGSVNSAGNYLAPNSGRFYICARAYQAGDAFTITLTDEAEVTDNRLCTYAQPIALGETITPTTTYTDYWYTVDLEAGKDYKFEGKEGGYLEGTLYNACGGTELANAYLGGNNLSVLYAAEATGTYHVKVRAYQDGSTLKISEVTTPTVQSVEIFANNGMSVQKGGTQKFAALVTVAGGAAKTVTWSVTGGTASSIADGTLTIGATETATILVVTATSTADNSKKASVTVTVTTDELVAAVLGVVVTPNTASVAKGSTRQFEAVVVVQGNAGTGITWSVSDNNDTGTSISASGLLTVAAAETASRLTVIASSTVDASKREEARVTVTAAGSTGTETVTEQDTPLRPYPNPVTTGQLTIANEQLQAGDRIAIYNMNGGLMGVYKVSSGASTTLNIGHLPAGIYIVKAGKKTAKVVKQ